MTQVGHILTGAAIGVAFLPENKTARWKTVYFIALAVLANAPDLQLPFWGHHRYYYVSHSLFTNSLILFLIICLFACWKKLRLKIGGWSVLAAGSLTWLSHLLLDTFYNQEKGLMMFWPFSEARLCLAIPWFRVVESIPPPITMDHVRIVLIELAFYGSFLVFTILVKMLMIKLHKRNKNLYVE